jgi:putative chitinase
VQLTWLANYQRAEKEIGYGLVKDPDLALTGSIAALIMVRGMSEGWFTGKRLGDYFSVGHTDWLNARRIINGLDCAARIGGYALHFMSALTPKEPVA